MEVYDAINPRAFLSSRGKIIYSKISNFLQDLLGYSNNGEFFVIESMGEEDYTQAYIINGKISMQIIEEDICSLLEEYKKPLLKAKSPPPINIKGNKFGGFYQPDHITLEVKALDYPKVSRDIMRIYYFEDSESPTLKEIIEKRRNKRYTTPFLASKEERERGEDFLKEKEILGPYQINSKIKIGEVMNEKKFREFFGDNKSCFVVNRKYDIASVLSFKKIYDGLEEKLDDNKIECYNFRFFK